MAGVRVIVRGVPELHAQLAKLRSPGNARILSRALLKSAYEIQRVAAREKIIRGGVVGRGKNRTETPPHPFRVTSRSGALRRSIAVDRGPLPFAVEVGSNLRYAPVHEFGGTYRMTRRTKGGTTSYTATYPARPFLQPALDDVAKTFSDLFAAEIKKELAL